MPHDTTDCTGDHPHQSREREKRNSYSITDLEQLLVKSLLSCDLKWSLFVAAARSYRHSSVLRPFPAQFYGEDECHNINQLRNCIDLVPKFVCGPDIRHLQLLPEECLKILSWVLLSNVFQLELKDRDSCIRLIKELTGQVMGVTVPHFIFEIIPHPDKQQKFEHLRNGRKTFYAYHGSRLDNFYSILHSGLCTHLNKVSVFGEGTYLSSELSVSLLYSQAGEGWRNSNLGTKLSCVAVCEMIDDPSVKCQIREGNKAAQRRRAQASQITDAVPEKYYVVQNNDVIRVKYLLVYKEENSIQSSSGTRVSRHSWLYDHKFLLLMLAYALLLVGIGIANSRQATNYVHHVFKSLRIP